jgi:hypothetical protein
MRTPAQQAASRQNGKLSQGPKTTPSKAISRRNSLKTGLTGHGIVLSQSMQAEVDSQKAHFETTYNPTDPESRQLVETAALAFTRTLHLMRAQHELGLQRVRNALQLHDAERQDRVHNLVNQLSTAPQHALDHLQRFTEGCDYLADAFDAVAAELKATGTLTPDSQLHARHLHGLEETTYATTPQLAAFLQNLANLPCLRLPAPVAGEGQGEGNSTAPFTPAAQSLLTHLEAQAEAWQEAADTHWHQRDELDRTEAPDRAYFDPSLEAQRLHRYLTRAQRTYEQTIKTLDARAESASPACHTFSPAAPTRSAEARATITNAPPPRPAPPVTRSDPPRKNEPTTSQPLSLKDFEEILTAADQRVTHVDFSITPRVSIGKPPRQPHAR